MKIIICFSLGIVQIFDEIIDYKSRQEKEKYMKFSGNLKEDIYP